MILFFFCSSCQSERPIAKRKVVGRKTACSECFAAADQFKRTGKCERGSPYSKTVGHKQDSWSEDALPQDITDRYAESIAD
jgi:hypothetical protein